MFTPANQKELEDYGVTVVPGVISQEDCDRHQAYFRQWLTSFPKGEFPQCRNSLVQRYSSGHMQPAWEARLAAKQVFSQIWGTEKLLTSMDAVAIGRPPEEGQENFWSRGQSWLHVDQTAERKGLHAYQGAVYLESCEEDDWTFEVIKGSHKYFDEFMTTQQMKGFKLRTKDVQWFKDKGCETTRIPCPKGGMVLWDSQLFHANARPLQGRSNPGRWRFVVFVCMTPASWASPKDLEKKREAYENMLITNHWPSQGIKTFPTRLKKNQARDPNPLKELPEVAKSEKAKKLAGMLSYEEEDHDNAPEFRPVWDIETLAPAIEMESPRGRRKRTRDLRETSKKEKDKKAKKQ